MQLSTLSHVHFFNAVGQDYVGIDLPTTVELSPAISRQCVNITILDDDIVENDELFSVHIATSDPAVIDISITNVTILEDDDSTYACMMSNRLTHLLFRLGLVVIYNTNQP